MIEDILKIIKFINNATTGSFALCEVQGHALGALNEKIAGVLYSVTASISIL